MIHKYKKIKFNQQKKYTKYYLLEIVILISLFIGLYSILSIKSADMSAIKANLEENLKLDSINIGDEKTLKNLYTPRIPPASTVLKTPSINCNFTVEPQTFTTDLSVRLRSL